jgi:hypothetical protein
VDRFGIGKSILGQVRIEPAAAANLRKGIGNPDRAGNTLRVQARVEELLQVRNVIPIPRPLGLLAANQIRQRQKRKLSTAVCTDLSPRKEFLKWGQQVVATPEFKPLFLTIGQVAEQKASKCPRLPAVPFDRARGLEEAGSREPVGEIVPTIGRKREVEVVCVPLEAVEADGVAAHDEAR